MTDLVAQERKFVANSRLKNAEKINFSWNLVPIKTVLLLPFFLKDPVDEDVDNEDDGESGGDEDLVDHLVNLQKR